MPGAEARPRWLDYLDVDTLQPDPSNPKDHAGDDIDKSMTRFGYTEPVVIDERTMRLLSGHGRVEQVAARRAAGGDAPDGVVVEKDRWLLPVVRGVATKNDIEARAYLIAANRLTEKGGWKADPLAALLSEIAASPLELEGIGYGPDDLEDMLARLAPPSLDDLEEQYGEPDPTHTWPVLRFKVSPEARQRYLRLVDGVEGGDAVLFDRLLDLAER